MNFVYAIWWAAICGLQVGLYVDSGSPVLAGLAASCALVSIALAVRKP